MLAYEQVLCYYNPERHLKLLWDASHMALTAGVFFVYILGTFKWTKADDGYSEIDKEAHLIYRGIHKFNTYLCVKHLTLVTDHKSLLRMSISSKGLPKCLLHGLNIILTSFLDIYMTADIKVHILNVNTFLIASGLHEN